MAVQTYIKGGTSVQISASIEQAIRETRLAPGEQLPTVRALAERLGVSPATVANAYKSLRTRGLLSASGRRGTAVSQRPPVSVHVPAPLPAGVRNLALGNPDPRLLPPLADALREIDATHVLYGMELKEPALMRLAARDLERDGIGADSLTMVSGAMDAIERVLAAHLRAGDRVVVEDPGFTGVLDLLAALGLTAVPCAIDDAGMLPGALSDALAAGAQALIVTPRAQNPTGAALDATRSRELRRVLRQHPDVLLIEDDHAAWVAGVPLHALSTEPPRRWAFARSLSKSLAPDLRLAILSGDAETIARVEGRQVTGMRWVSRLLQRTAVAVWSARSTAGLLRKAATAYAARRGALIDALAAEGIEAHGRSGMNVWIPAPDETAAVQSLLQQGWAVTAGARFRVRSGSGVRVTVSMLEPKDAPALARAIAETVRPRSLSASA